jgi:hypothetical protein
MKIFSTALSIAMMHMIVALSVPAQPTLQIKGQAAGEPGTGSGSLDLKNHPTHLLHAQGAKPGDGLVASLQIHGDGPIQPGDHFEHPRDTIRDRKKDTIKKDYMIHRERNLKSVQFVRRRKGEKIQIHFRRMRFIPKETTYVYFLASSGIKYVDQKPIEIRDAEFPFSVRLRFKAPNETQTQIRFYTLHFTIYEPGYWEVIMDY